jgi:hypothetical protein
MPTVVFSLEVRRIRKDEVKPELCEGGDEGDVTMT